MAKFVTTLLWIFLCFMLKSGVCKQDAMEITIETLRKMMNADAKIADDTKEFMLGEDFQPRVQTTSGLIYGISKNYSQAFYSIPFAIPPIDNLRFQPPQMLDTPSSTRNHSIKTYVGCAQSTNDPQEDCLVLSIDVPKHVDLMDSDLPPSDRLPVLLFIHGGAFFLGSGTYNSLDGRYLSNVTNTIVVTINYRLGPLGFLVYDDGENSFDGNQGLKDQQLALKWIQNNIENFGGDKNRVTIFGESAGAQSVMFHLVSLISEPMFQAAIMESNPAVYPYPTRAEALEITDRVVDSLRCSVLNAQDCCIARKSNYTCLMEAPAENLISAMFKIMAQDWAKLDPVNAIEPFRPYIDEVEYTKQPMNLFMEGSWNKNKPVIIGTNEEEVLVLKYILPLNEFLFRAVNQRLFDDVEEGLGEKISNKYIEFYPNQTDFGHLFGLEMTDIWFGCPSRALGRLAAETSQNSVYYYIFGHALDGEDCEEYYGNFCEHSFHGAEVIFVFRTIQHVGMIPDDHDILVSNQFSNYWGNLAWSGNPSEGPGFNIEGEFPDWTPYINNAGSNEDEIWTNVRFANPNAYLEPNYLEEICDFWDSLGVYPTNMAPATPPTTSTVSTSTKSTEVVMTTTDLGVTATTSDGRRMLAPSLLQLFAVYMIFMSL